MIINGVWKENITCPRCKYRHPPEFTCAEADAHARKSKVTVPCRYCETPTPYSGTGMCDRCWELEHRISTDPEIAARILEAVRAAAHNS